jgi:mRNA interferase YafQ
MKIRRHKKFLKDFKETRLSDSQFEKFVHYINLLRVDTPLPPESKDHCLLGNYKDCKEFHLGGDMLIVYLKSSDKDITLMRMGTHAKLF